VGEAAAGLHADDRQPPLLRAVPTDRRIPLVRHRECAGADLGTPGCDPGSTHQGRRRDLAAGAGDGMRTHVTSLEDGGLTKAYQIAHDAEHRLFSPPPPPAPMSTTAATPASARNRSNPTWPRPKSRRALFVPSRGRLAEEGRNPGAVNSQRRLTAAGRPSEAGFRPR